MRAALHMALAALLAALLAFMALAAAPAYAAADLSIAIARSGVFRLGNEVSYTVTVSNAGPGKEAGKISVGSNPVAGLTFTGGSGRGWTCAAYGGGGSCTYSAGLDKGVSAPALTVTAKATTEGQKRVAATVKGGNDPVAANNTATETSTAFGAADLSIAIVRSGTFQVGRTITYAVTVKNNGPGTEFGKITVGGTIAPGLRFTGVSGDGWACTASGTLGTCYYSAGLARDASTPALKITATVETAGEKKVTATVTGNADPNSANNTTSDTGTALAKDPPPQPVVTHYAFTDEPCAIGATIGDANACQYYEAPTTAGRATRMYVTATGAGTDGKARAKAPPAATVPMQFALRCLNPAAPAGIQALVGATVLPECAPLGESVPGTSRWSAASNVNFAAGQASVQVSFQYADVGQVELHLRQGDAPGTAAHFVSKPWQLAFRGISRGGVPAPSSVLPDGQAFAMAGEALLVEIGARVEDAGKVVYAPNFGKEAARPDFEFGRVALHTDPSQAAHLPAAPVPVADDSTWKGIKGSWSVNASWGEAGATTLTLGLDDYLGAGAVDGASRNVGRFYPAYFTTEISPPIACGSGIECPARPLDPIGVAFSGQGFTARVVARGLQGQELRNFTGAWYRTVKLSAVGGGGAAAPGVLAPAELTASGAATLTHTLPNPYSAAGHRANKWGAPTTFYLRAQAQDGLAPGGITSNRSPAASDEDGLVVVNGRLRVANALGTDMLRTPLALRAEYWSGSAWRAHPGHTEALAAAPEQARFSACTRTLAGAGTPCNELVAASGGPVALVKGAGVLWLRAPGKQSGSAQVAGKRRDGAVSVQFDGWPWLPSTIGRVHFGSHRSPLIYVREVY